MNTIMYLCEFFFTNFWHWLGGVIYLAIIFSTPLIYISKKKGEKK